VLAAPIRRGKMPSEPHQGLLHTLLGGWGGLAEAGHPGLDAPHRGSRGLFPTHDPSKIQSNYLNSTRTNPHPLNYLYISGGVSSPHPPKTIFAA